MARRIVRYPDEGMIAGVAAGIAEHLDVDPVLVRLGFVFLGLLNGVGVLLYVLLWIILPTREPRVAVAPEGAAGTEPAGASGVPPADEVAAEVRQAVASAAEEVRQAGATAAEAAKRMAAEVRTRAPGQRNSSLILGGLLIAVGLFFLIDELPWLRWPSWLRLDTLWPVLIIVVGIFLIFGATSRSRR